MDNYRRRGFRLFDMKVEDEPEIATPGPWPGAHPV
ncbi:GNAT family N-acetyltransferase [Streptomyces hirsutus]